MCTHIQHMGDIVFYVAGRLHPSVGLWTGRTIQTVWFGSLVMVVNSVALKIEKHPLLSGADGTRRVEMTFFM